MSLKPLLAFLRNAPPVTDATDEELEAVEEFRRMKQRGNPTSGKGGQVSEHKHKAHVTIQATIRGSERGGSTATLCQCGAVKAPHLMSGWGPTPKRGQFEQHPWPMGASYNILAWFQ